MLIKNNFEVAQPVDKVWRFFDDIPQVAACLPGTTLTDDLKAEGLARDLVRAVQQARRDTGLHVSDRISLTVQGGAEVFEATVTHRDLIVGETLAAQFAAAGPDHALPDGLPGTRTDVVVGDNHPATILVVKR